MTVLDVPRPRTVARAGSSSRHRARSQRDNFEPAMMLLVVFVLTYALTLVLPLTAGHGRALVVGAYVAGLAWAVYTAATVGTRR